MKTDSLFYRLFQERPELAFELAGWPVPVGGRYMLRAEEVKQNVGGRDGSSSAAGNAERGALHTPPRIGVQSRRRRITPRPAKSRPSRASEAGSGTIERRRHSRFRD